MQWAALDIPDPETPVGARGVGEAPVGAGFGAVVNAIAAAVGDEVFRRAPVTADMILTALEQGRADARAADGEHLDRGPRRHEKHATKTEIRTFGVRRRFDERGDSLFELSWRGACV